MGGLFGPSQGHAVATQATRANGIQVQASSFGRALPIVYGRSRIKGELIWYGDFQAVEHQQQVGKGGGSVSTSYTYSSSFALALCEGPIQKLGAIWKGSGQTTLADLQATLLTGAAGQSPWSHWSGAQALNYPYVAYVACLNLQLGSTPTVPNLNWEVYGLLPFNAAGGIYDAEPSAILNDLLTNPQHGAGWAYLGDLSLYRSYCAAMGIFISPVIEQENSALRHIGDLLTITNSTAVWSAGKLKIIPYSDQAASGNGYTYTPPTTAVADLGPDQLIEGVTVDRKPLADLYNTIRLEYLDASNNYVTTVAEAKDQADIDARAVRSQQTITAHAITSSALATQVAHRILNRQLYVRNTYRFKVPITQIALEPMDVVTLTDPLLDLGKEPVRITQIEENGDGTLSIEAEEFPAGVAEAASYSYEPLAGYVPDSEKAPDATQPPVFFRAPQFLVDSPEVWVGVAGAGPNWGGAHVWLSWDGNSYTHAGVVYRGTRYGITKTALNSGSDPDTANSVTLELYGPGQLNGASTADADRFVPLLLIDQELIAYSATTLNADGTYTLGPNYIRRGAYNTSIASHAAGAPWLRVDDHVWRFGFDPADVGKTVYIKFQAFNLVGGGLQDLSTVAAYTYVIGAAEEIPDVPPVPTNLTATPAANGVKLAWTNPNPAAVAIVSVEYSTDNATWAVLGQTNGEGLDHNFAGNATYYYRLRARSPSFAWSSYTTSVSASGGSLDHVNDGTTYGRTVQTALTTGQPDMSKIGVINRTADNVAETTGRKWAAESGAQVVTGKSIDILSDGTYARTLANQITGGVPRKWGQPPTAKPVFVNNSIATGAPLSGYAAGLTVSLPGTLEFDVLSDGGIVDVLLFASNGSTGPNGYVFRLDGRQGNQPGQTLIVTNGTWSLIGSAISPTNPSALSGWHHVVCHVGVGGRYDIFIDGSLSYSATDTTYSPNGSIYYGAEVTTGSTLAPAGNTQRTLDNYLDGTTYGRPVQTALTSGQPDMSKAGVINRTADNVAETTGRKWAAESGAQVVTGKSIDILSDGTTYGRTVQTALTSGQPDMSKAGVINRTLDYIANSTTRKAVSAVDANSKALIDFSAGGHVYRGSTPQVASNPGWSYSSTASSITLSWTAFTMYWADGTTTAIGAGSNTVSALTASTTYYFYPYLDVGTNAVNVGAAYTSTSYVGLQIQVQYNHAPLTSGALSAATAASGGTGGGGLPGSCLHEDTCLLVLRGGQPVNDRAANVRIGDCLWTPDGWQQVESVEIKPQSEWIDVWLSNGEKIRVTPTQPFRTIHGEWIRANKLTIGLALEGQHQDLHVVGLEPWKQDGRKVIIGIPPPHAFYCGGVVVHNGISKP